MKRICDQRWRFADDRAGAAGLDVQGRVHVARPALQDFRRAGRRLRSRRRLRRRRLKRLSDAIADSDRILAVIRGSAVNQDGRSTLLTAPNGPAQAALIREALASAQVEPERIGFFEAHGTGTALGDPIEVEAIVKRIGRAASQDRPPCLLGSIKANLGHLEAAAGVTRLDQGRARAAPRGSAGQANFSKLNPHISLTGTRACRSNGADAVAGRRAAAMRGGQLVRHWRHQCQRDRRGSP